MTAKPGDKVVYIGYSDRNQDTHTANGIFIKGDSYIVDEVQQDGYITKLKICGTNMFFPSIFFKEYNPAHHARLDAPAKPDQDQMMLRDQFAMAAMQAMLQGSIMGSVKIEGLAEKSYMVADALMEARKPK